MKATDGNFFLIMHPLYDSFAVIHIDGEYPPSLPEELKRLLPGNKTHWAEGFAGFEKRKEKVAEGVKYRVVTQFAMI
jgi:hypothetical protein